MSESVNEVARLKGKKIGAIDFGTYRIGFAVCDSMHITVSPKGFFKNNPAFWDEIQSVIAKEHLGALVVGMPYPQPHNRTNLIEVIEFFITQLKEHVSVPVFVHDESYSTRKAYSLMHDMKMPQKKIHEKGKKDEVAAAIILREFLDEIP